MKKDLKLDIFCETSAKTGSNVKHAFQEMARLLNDKPSQQNMNPYKRNIKLDKKGNSNKNGRMQNIRRTLCCR
jgi:hypothetical protein